MRLAVSTALVNFVRDFTQLSKGANNEQASSISPDLNNALLYIRLFDGGG
jgi:hypothetical protein